MKRQRYDERMEAGELVDVVRKQLTMLSNGVKKVARMFRGDVLQIDGAEVFNVSEYELADDTKVVLFEDSRLGGSSASRCAIAAGGSGKEGASTNVREI